MTAPLFHMIAGAPQPVAPFSHATEVDGWVFVTGQMPTYPDDDSRALYLTHFETDYPAFNAVYRSYFAPGRLPARTCIGVTALARGARVEVDFLARRP